MFGGLILKRKILSNFLGMAIIFSMFSTIVQPLSAIAISNNVNGLLGQYYTFTSTDTTFPLQTLKSQCIDHSINSDDLTPLLNTMTGQKEYTAVRWTGKIQAKVTGAHTFYYKGDNGVRIWVDGQLILDHWVNDWDNSLQSTAVSMTAGQKYDIKIEYFQASGGANFHLSWSAPGLVKEDVPSDCLYLDPSYAGPVITSLDTSNASLVYPNISGTINVQGLNLVGSSVEVLDSKGNEFIPQKKCSITSSLDTSLTVKVPTSLTSGMYMFLVANGTYKIKSDAFRISVDAEGTQPRSEYPRPDWQRQQWMNLNGQWSFDFDANVTGDAQNWQTSHTYGKQITVPYCWESALSGVNSPSYLGVAWYERDFTLDTSWTGKKVILNFGAVDWRCKVWVNGHLLGSHEGGYNAFDYDVTSFVTIGGVNKVTVRVEDYDQNNPNPTQNDQLIGKQGYDAPVGYTHTSGIWQTVYLVARDSDTYIKTAQANSDIDNSKVTFNVNILNSSSGAKSYTLNYDFKGTLNDVANGSNFSGVLTVNLPNAGENIVPVTITIPDQKLWDTVSPNLYEGSFELLDGTTQVDKVSTYFGQKKLSTEKFATRDYNYVNINNKPVFLSGALDQGFWPDGIYTAPTNAALKKDVKNLKDAGFNLIRIHMKIEDPLEYYWADKLGMLIWQDMPWGPNMNATDNQPKIGRASYESALKSELERDYNHPSIIAIILFNETWGINHNADTHAWMGQLYNTVKTTHPSLLAEDMSACNSDHIQPTDLFTFHMYPGNVSDVKSFVNQIDTNTVIGSTFMFRTDNSAYKYEGEPWLNSEYGGVSSGSGDLDVSWCFKYQTTVQRLHEKLNGYVYTEPYDVEYEKNGIFNENRTAKIFGYNEIAYGGDMSLKYLNQPDFIGFYNDPIVKLKPGSTFTGQLGAMNWSGNNYTNLNLKWRFDGTDSYGKDISTGISGSMPVNFTPYTLENKNFSFVIPNTAKFSNLVGTVTAWIEDASGKVIAKNFTNVTVSTGVATNNTIKLTDNSYALRQPALTNVINSGEYTYTLPQDFNINNLNDLRVIAEMSSVKASASQTAVGEEAPSDVTASINGHEFTTVTLPDDPRDMRGTLSLDNGKASATDFGYLVNLSIPQSIIATLKTELATNKTITVKYAIKSDAQNDNGLKFYSETQGRYAVNPMIIINPDVTHAADVTGNGSTQLLSQIASASNYTVESNVTVTGNAADTAGVVARADTNKGYNALISKDGTTVSLTKADGSVIKSVSGLSYGDKTHHIKMSLFDAHIRIYIDNEVVPVIDTYDYSFTTGKSGVTNTSGSASFTTITQEPETYGLVSGSDSDAITVDKNAINLGDTTSVYNDIILPTSGDNGTVISWYSNNKAIVSDAGVVTRPVNGTGDATVKLTATVTKGSQTQTKEFTLIVKEQGKLIAQYNVPKKQDKELKNINDLDIIRGEKTP
jgi:hypothetical protein